MTDRAAMILTEHQIFLSSEIERLHKEMMFAIPYERPALQIALEQTTKILNQLNNKSLNH